MAEAYDRTRLNYDEWLGGRIERALEAIRYSEFQGLESALELVAFAEDVLNHFEPIEATPLHAAGNNDAGFA